MDLSRAEGVARGIVAAMLANQVRDRALTLQWGLLGLAVLGLAGIVGIEGWSRWLALPFLLFGLAGFSLLFGGRKLVLGAIQRFIAPPGDIDQLGDAVTEALERADLPDGPVAAVRMVWRLRRGVSGEVARLRGVVEDLIAALG